MEKILCPTDFTPSSSNALHFAKELASSSKARLIIFHTVVQPEYQPHVPVVGVPYVEPIPDPAETKARETQITLAREKLFSLAQSLPGSESQIRVGSVVNTLVQAANETEADLIVLGHEGLQDISPASVTSKIIGAVSCPICIIPPQVTFQPPQKIVYATDLRADAFTNVSLVLQIAALYQAQVHFLHVLADEAPDDRAAAQAGLRLLCKHSPYPHVSYALEMDKNISDGISRYCLQENADLLVMGSRNKNFWQHLFMQNKTRELASSSIVPLMVLPHRG